MKVRSDRDVPEGMVFMPFCYAEAAANLLTNPALDPYRQDPRVQILCGTHRTRSRRTSKPRRNSRLRSFVAASRLASLALTLETAQ